MLNSVRSLVGALAILVATPAYACMANGPSGFASGLIWQSPPTDLPKSAILLKVRRVGSVIGSFGGFRIEILEGPRRMVGRTYRVVSEAGHDCVSWGEKKRYLVIRPRSISLSVGEKEEPLHFLAAIDFPPVWYNGLLPPFDFDAFTYPGSRRSWWDW